jgi:hypothetical protein
LKLFLGALRKLRCCLAPGSLVTQSVLVPSHFCQRVHRAFGGSTGQEAFRRSPSDLQYLDLHPTVLQHIVVSIPSPSAHGLADDLASFVQFWSPSAQPPLWGYTPKISQDPAFYDIDFSFVRRLY